MIKLGLFLLSVVFIGLLVCVNMEIGNHISHVITGNSNEIKASIKEAQEQIIDKLTLYYKNKVIVISKQRNGTILIDRQGILP